ncbi:hypothetical protein LUZ60_013232 [Juncus effusus]|nr:hypothetical protein LUZ60_013232 [Juncus effusus]
MFVRSCVLPFIHSQKKRKEKKRKFPRSPFIPSFSLLLSLPNSIKTQQLHSSIMAKLRLMVFDFALATMWIWAGALVKLLVVHVIAPSSPHDAEMLKIALSVGYMFLFAWLERLTGGGSYNPLTVLVSTVTGNGHGYLFSAFGRIPAQVLGATLGVKLLKSTFPQIGHGPRLATHIHHGAMTEGLATFVVIMVSLTLKKKRVDSFFVKTWISSISKMSLHVLSSDLTGGIMNPASAFGWAFARGDHVTIEHVLVYWFAPIQATIFGIWAVRFFAKPELTEAQKTEEKEEIKSKSE